MIHMGDEFSRIEYIPCKKINEIQSVSDDVEHFRLWIRSKVPIVKPRKKDENYDI